MPEPVPGTSSRLTRNTGPGAAGGLAARTARPWLAGFRRGRALRGPGLRPGGLARRRGIGARRGLVAGSGVAAARPVIPGTRVVVGILTGLGQRPVQLVLVELRRVERLPPAPVRQRQPRGGPHVHGGDLVPALPCRVRDRRPRGHQVRAQPVHVERRAHRRHLPQRRRRAAPRPGSRAWAATIRAASPASAALPPRGERRGVGVVGQPPPDHLAAQGRRPAGRRPPRSARTGRAVAGAVRPPPGSSCRPAGTGPRAGQTPRPAPRSRCPARRRRAAGRPGGRAAG